MPPQNQQQQQERSDGRPDPLTCELFQGINTLTTRCGVPDQQMYWCDGFIPLSPRNLRVLPGIGPALYTGGANTIAFFDFYNIGSTPYMVVFKTDGSVTQVRTSDGATTQILPAFSIQNPVITNVGVAQYGSQYLIIVANQINGYWLWDGSLLYTAGTLAPTVTLTNPGSGYFAPPIVTATGGNGHGATFVASIGGGVVTNVVMTNPGTGYLASDTPTLVFSGGNTAGSGASLTAVLSHVAGGSGAVLTMNFSLVVQPDIFGITSVTVNNGGSGYSVLTQVIAPSIPPAGNFGAVLSPVISGGVITAVNVIRVGQYVNATPTGYTIVDNGYYTVTAVTGTPTGTNYGPSATITASGGGSPQTQATLTPQITTGVITGVTIVNGGVYGSNTPPSLAVSDTMTNAAGTISLMPFGVQGNTVETYSGHVWVAKGALVEFTAPGSVTDFSTSNGGGSFTSSDSFLRVGFTRLIQSNGFLFLIGDSSMNYISGVQTSTPAMGSPTTTFTNNNSDPETGTPYPASVLTIGQDIFLANQNGVYVSSGGTFQKKSDMLDGVYNSAPGLFNGMQLSAAKQLVFGKLVWMVLVPIIDPVTKTLRNKLFMFNEKYWWSSEQDVSMVFIASQEINSTFQSYGTDGTKIYPMFTTPSVAFTKRFQSRLWDTPAGYDHTKSDVNLFAIAQFVGSADLSYNVFIDNENGFTGRAGPYTHSGATADIEVFSIMPPQAIGQVGVLTGMTVETTADDLVIASIMLQPEVVGYRA